MSKDHEKDFFDYAFKLLGEQVQVITVEGTYNGELKALESDFLLLVTHIRGQYSLLAIRFNKIIGISRSLVTERRRPFFFGQQRLGEVEHHKEQHEEGFTTETPESHEHGE